MERLDALLHRAVQESNRRDKCVASLERTAASQPVHCDPAVQGALAQAAEDLSPGRWMKLPSGAGHDAQCMAAHIPTGMLFVPSIGGVSHHWSEDTRPEDLALGVQVLAGAARRLLDRG
jgi:N-carbamoyl-L-amino-acid hydrolase